MWVRRELGLGFPFEQGVGRRTGGWALGGEGLAPKHGGEFRGQLAQWR